MIATIARVVISCKVLHSCASFECTVGVAVFDAAMLMSERSSPSVNVTIPAVGRRKRATVAWWSTPSLFTTSYSTIDRWIRNHVRRPRFQLCYGST